MTSYADVLKRGRKPKQNRLNNLFESKLKKKDQEQTMAHLPSTSSNRQIPFNYVIKGSFSQASERFPPSFRNTQCTSNSVVAICMNAVRPISTWSTHDIDSVLNVGHIVHVESIKALSEATSTQFPTSYLVADEVLKNININYTTSCNVTMPIYDTFQGRAGEDSQCLAAELRRFFAQSYTTGVFTANLKSIAIFKDDNSHWYFDPHSRDPTTGFYTSEGVALAMRFDTIEDMHRLVHDVFELHGTDLFVIRPVLVQSSNRPVETIDVLEIGMEIDISDRNSDPLKLNNTGMKEQQNGSINKGNTWTLVASKSRIKQITKNEDNSLKNNEHFKSIENQMHVKRIKRIYDNEDLKKKVKEHERQDQNIKRIKTLPTNKEYLIKEKNNKNKLRKKTHLSSDVLLKQLDNMNNKKRINTLRKGNILNKKAKCMKTVRGKDEYKEKEKLQNTKRIKTLREKDKFKAGEILKNAQRIKSLREVEDFKAEENLKNAQRIKSLREVEDFKAEENLKNAQRIKTLREVEDFKAEENLKTAQRIKTLREVEDFKAEENLKNAKRIKTLREVEDFKAEENLRNAKRIKTLRIETSFKAEENTKNAERIKIMREHEGYVINEKIDNQQRMVDIRDNNKYREIEKGKNKKRMRSLRKGPGLKPNETENNNVGMSDIRNRSNSTIESGNFAEMGGSENLTESVITNELFNKNNIKKNANSATKGEFSNLSVTKENVNINKSGDCSDYRNKERITDKQSKIKKRDHHVLRHREIYKKNLLRQNTPSSKVKIDVIGGRNDVPEFICTFCDGLFFKHSVKYLFLEQVKDDEDWFLELEAKRNSNHSYICNTCNKYIKKKKIPPLSTCNGLIFPSVPECVKDLSDLEERMVAPIINFMQVRPLMPYSINPQLGMKGSVVNIPIDVNEMTHTLPRTFDKMSTIQIKLKRHVMHTSNYMYETIRPSKVYSALLYLKDTPLYKLYDVNIDTSFFNVYQAANEVDFIVDERDLHLSETDISRNEDIEKLGLLGSQNNDDYDLSGEQVEECEEVMLVNRNKESSNNIEVIAPGQNKKPLPWHIQPHIEELSFPKIYGGHALNITSDISYSDRAKSEARRSDRRSCVPTKVLYMAKKKLEFSCLSNINTCLRKKKNNVKIKARDALNADFINNLVNHDDGYRILKQVRSSPSYWEDKKKNLLGMIRQLGKPTFFITLSAAERNWPELLKMLAKVLQNKNLNLEQAISLSDYDKNFLIKNDPITCARYFEQKISKLMWYLKNVNGPFNEYTVTDSYERVEFQLRGSPHEHIFVWLKNAPNCDLSDERSIDLCVEFIDKFITCEFDENNPYMAYIKHRHTHTCHKGKRNKKKCRFNFPMPVLPRTMILTPLNDSESEICHDHKGNYKKIKNLMHSYYMKTQDVPFNEILNILHMTEEDYILALRSSMTRPQVFLKRKSTEVAINSYNQDLLNLHEANIDIQLVVEEYGLASYVVNYISKIDTGMTTLLREAACDITNKFSNAKEKLKTIANVFINSNLMSAQEAAYHVLSLPLSKSSRGTVFINTSPISERVMMLKSKKDLSELDLESNDVFMDNILSKYSKRPQSLNNVCLADYAANFNARQKANSSTNDDENVELCEWSERKRTKLIRYRNYKLSIDPTNYFREQILLFSSWRNELEDVENVNHFAVFKDNLEEIKANASKYCTLPDDIMEQALSSATNEVVEIQEEEQVEFITDKLPKEQIVNIMDQGGFETTDISTNRYSVPLKITTAEINTLLLKLNEKQRNFVMHVYNSFIEGNVPLHIFLSGSAGVGKSMVINTLYQMISHYYDIIPGENVDAIKVLLCAPSGKAAFLIHGVTLHTAFALPVSQFGGQMTNLSNDVANTIREQLFHLKCLIIDEISMVGSTLLNRVDTRLRQITGKNEIFGGISVIVVGDLNQLPPVMDAMICQPPRGSDLSIFCARNPTWDNFKLYELTQIMRQQDETELINALNNLAIGKMTADDVSILKSREVSDNDVPANVIRLFYENSNVDEYNNYKINISKEVEYISDAKDVVIGKVSESIKARALKTFKNKKATDTGGLTKTLKLKVNIKYMITTNINVEDGLVNGTCGVLKEITFKPNSNSIDKLWMSFAPDERVGKSARLPLLNYMEAHKINVELVPIVRKVHVVTVTTQNHYQIVREQFPLTPAEALTIHKSQGQTFKQVCVDLRKSKRITRQLLYVALSRVTKLSGLYILGTFKEPNAPKPGDIVTEEMKRLRLETQLKVEPSPENVRIT